MLDRQRLVAFAGVTDLAAARTFYGDTLGLPLLEQSDFACVFDANGTTLRVTKVDQTGGAKYTVLGWSVDGIEDFIDRLTERGVSFLRYDGMGQDQRGIWTVPGGAGRVAWFEDPAGNVLSLSEAG
jgi:catechol 2,3-dioxygenase-like lactoylglutathione lyase family enzyme